MKLKEHFIEKVVPAMLTQIESDDKRWGNEWQKRPREGQEERIFARFDEYYGNWKQGEPIPWLKIIGLANIALARENHPEWTLPAPPPPDTGIHYF